MKFRGALLLVMAVALPAAGKTCPLSKIEDLDQSTIGSACSDLPELEQLQLMACMIYVKGKVIKTAQPLKLPISLSQMREVCAGFVGATVRTIIKPGPFSAGVDKELLQRMNDDQIKKLNVCVDQNSCTGSAFISAFSKGIPYDSSIQYSICVSENSCSPSAFSFLIERTGNFAQSVQYSRCVSSNDCSASTFEWATSKNIPFNQSMTISHCAGSNDCSVSSFQWLIEHGGTFDQSLRYSKCASENNCSSSALQWKVEADKALNFEDAMELSQCVSANRCSLSLYQKAYQPLGGNHGQAMTMSRE